jgi:hypothetical protein
MRDALPLVFDGDDLLAVADLWLDARRRVPQHQPGLAIRWTEAPLVA